jgi:hypothetical protein
MRLIAPNDVFLASAVFYRVKGASDRWLASEEAAL